MTEKDLINCNPPTQIKDVNIDDIPNYCKDGDVHSLKGVSGPGSSWLNESGKYGNGHSALCNPVQRGHIINDQDGMGSKPSREVVYRYSKALRGCDEAMTDLFRDIIVIDESGKSHNIPIIWGPQEKAVEAIVQQNVRKDDSAVVDRIRLPMLAITGTAIPVSLIGHAGIQSSHRLHSPALSAGRATIASRS